MPTSIENSHEFGPASEDAVQALEASLGTDLPHEYRVFLTEHNGGIPDPDTFEIPELGQEATIETFFGIHDGPKHVSLAAHVQEWGPSLLPRYLAIGYEQGGNPICLCLQEDDRGAIYLWDQQLDENLGVTEATSLYRLADSIERFLERLGT